MDNGEITTDGPLVQWIIFSMETLGELICDIWKYVSFTLHNEPPYENQE